MRLLITDGLSYEDHRWMAEYEGYYFAQHWIVPPEIRYRWYQFNEYTMIAVRDSVSRKIVAHLGTLPLKNEIYERYRSGAFRNEEIGLALLGPNIDVIRKYDEPGLYILYCFSTAIHPDYLRKTNALRLLLNGFAQVFLKLAGNGIYVSQLFGHPVTPEGVKLCRILNMRPDAAVDSRFYANKMTVTLFRAADNPLRNTIVKMYNSYFAGEQSTESTGSELNEGTCF